MQLARARCSATVDGEATGCGGRWPSTGKDEPVRVLLGRLWQRRPEPAARPDVPVPQRCSSRGLGDPWPDSLLFHLARLSLRRGVALGPVGRGGTRRPTAADARTLRDFGQPFPSAAAWVGRPGLGARDHRIGRRGAARAGMADLGAPGDVDRATAALLDSATHRLDPWAVGARLAPARRAGTTPRACSGLYGFVDDPFRGEPGLGDRGVILAPSPDQVKTAAIVRDRAAAHHLQDGLPPSARTSRWTPSGSGPTLRVTRAVREGAHPAEASGASTNALLPDDSVVRAFRDAYPAHAHRRAAPYLRRTEGR